MRLEEGVNFFILCVEGFFSGHSDLRLDSNTHLNLVDFTQYNHVSVKILVHDSYIFSQILLKKKKKKKKEKKRH